MNKFGIAIDSKGFVTDIKYFEADEFTPKYFEISESQFYHFVSIRTPYSKFIGGELINDSEDETNYTKQNTINELRSQLENLSVKIDLAEKMKEDTTELYIEFDRIKVMYENITSK